MPSPFPPMSKAAQGSLTRFATPRRCLFAALTFFVLMVVLGSIPGQADAMSAAAGDKVLHFAAYSVLTVLVYHALTVDGFWRMALTVLTVALMVLIDEGIQLFLPYRHAAVADWHVDVLAALACISLLQIFDLAQQAKKRQRQSQAVPLRHTDRMG